MKKREKRNRRIANKIRNLKVGDDVWVEYRKPDGEQCNHDAIIDEIGNGYIVVNHIIIEMNELVSIRKT